MIYAIEYLNEEAALTVIEYDPANRQTFTSFVSLGNNRDYVEPSRIQVYFCEKHEEEDLRSGIRRAWYRKLATFSISDVDDENDEMVDAYIPINDMLEKGELVELFDQLIAQHDAPT